MFVEIVECFVNTFPLVIDGLLSCTVDGRDIRERDGQIELICTEREKE